MEIKIGKYNNWRTSIEGDYFSLYIKTWFAFLSTLHELYPEKINSVGDGSLIRHFSENIQVPSNYEEQISPAIKLMFQAAETVMKTDFAEYYFSSFYELNKIYRFKQKNIDGHIGFLANRTKIEFSPTATGIRKRTKDQLYFELRSNQNQFLTHLKPIIGDNKTYTLNTTIDLGEIIRDKSYDDKYAIIQLAKKSLYEKIDEIFITRRHTEKQKEKASHFFGGVIESSFQSWALNFESDDLFKKLPNRDYPNTEASKRQTLKWFIKYSYKLRNVLFHIIIDPFDKNWQPIYKNTYIALKELVDENIKIIKEKESEQAIITEVPEQNNSSEAE
jgi:hypothetical protein